MGIRSKDVPLFKPTFKGPEDEFDGSGKRPVVFDLISPDGETSILPEGMKLVLHVNPSTFAPSWEKVIERIQTKGGWVEQHWGEGLRSVSFEMATGGFKRLYAGLSNITGGGYDAGGTRRQTIAYDKYLDILALFHNNGSIYDSTGQLVLQGLVKMSFDGGTYFGWFSEFSVEESAEVPFMFRMNASFTVSHEILRLRSVPLPQDFGYSSADKPAEKADAEPEFGNLEIPDAVEDSRPGKPVNPTGNAAPQSAEDRQRASKWRTLLEGQRKILSSELDKGSRKTKGRKRRR